jgi:hypothetical protein
MTFYEIQKHIVIWGINTLILKINVHYSIYYSLSLLVQVTSILNRFAHFEI